MPDGKIVEQDSPAKVPAGVSSKLQFLNQDEFD